MQDGNDTFEEAKEAFEEAKEAFKKAMDAEGWTPQGEDYVLGNIENGFTIMVGLQERGVVYGSMTMKFPNGDPISVSGRGGDTKDVFEQLHDLCADKLNNMRPGHESAPTM